MTNEQIFELAEEHGDWDDFGRWTFRDNDRLLAFVDAILKVERETCAVLIESTPTMLGSPKRDNPSWIGLTDDDINFYWAIATDREAERHFPTGHHACASLIQDKLKRLNT